ncbi:asparagine synthase (glutamine-hydrolyzing) [Catalinimonas alkaloidigena]|uniref:asparagine synthase (glutamine-hydrolyzing) n=1 Tax=Catalinimonas alkaloidigena TaxID=1075417 RepID=UPI002406401A|nr:asparagine synthase (glutamine-hydrolyzing) [Catalinimonas alkaloidigena]MDF9795010.1 asparagine synthase (glutamine-hydrolyzing) [Catalinimonas alkaloidigena]
MCGIHLIFDKKLQLAAAKPTPLIQMLNVSAYRGPDAQGTQSLPMRGGNLHLGSNRLKIIDPRDSANQPMVSADGRYWLCFNGTVYNYYELRNELLGQGVQFSTQSDTEVLLYLLISEGRAALDKLNGMFALFFYDSQKQKLLLARDRFGMKPLFYTNDQGYFICSSEAKCITSSGLLEKKLYAPAVQDYMCFRYVNPPYTFFEKVYQLPAGSYMEINGEKVPEICSYAGQITRKSEISEAEVMENTEELLQDAVLNHLVGDVPSGLLLSGGVDSTLLLSLIKEQGAHPVPTFSIINSEKEAAFGTRDYYYARKAAELYGSRHYELTLESQMLRKHHQDFLTHIDQPVGDSAAFMTFMISAEVKKLAGVALSGAGADELFAGYNRHQAYRQYLRYYDIVVKFSGFVKNGTNCLPTGFAHPLRKQFRLLKKLGQSMEKDPALTFINFTAQTSGLQNSQQLSSLKNSEAGGHTDFEERWLRAALEHDLSNYLPADVLALSDNMSMAHSLEMRMPYLDLPLTNYVRSLPAGFRMKHGKKWILKRLLEKRGGKVFSTRSKEGFGLPFGQWLHHDETEYIRHSLQRREQLIYEHISYEQVQYMLQAHLQKKKDYNQGLWAVWMLASWLEIHFP